ncbi:acyltransferase family protein [Tundrisphaera lichenicola]|uniref:acyltransferase family protein n=1 Tax=Tundrisphaera lichenicola TaxID=2029860 RepID=UPI003EBF113F
MMIKDRRLIEAGENRENNFDALRVALALMVILSHSYPILQGSNSREPLFRWTGGQKTAGELAVEGFFLISGYLIAASWLRSRGLLDYLRRRTLRIVPGFLVAVAFSSLLVGPLLSGDAGLYWSRFEVRLFLIRALNLEGSYAPGLTTNGSLWSIRYEFLCYLAVAALGLVGILRRRSLVVLALVGCLGIYACQIHLGLKMPGSRLTWFWGFPDFWPRLAASFLAGVCFYLYSDRVILSNRLAIASTVVLILAAVFPSAKLLPLLIPPLGGYLLFYLAYFPAGRLSGIAKRGDLTYGLYLYAFPIQLLLVKWFKPQLGPLGLFLAASALTAILAALSWHFVERPSLGLRHARRPSRVIPPPDAPPDRPVVASMPIEAGSTMES